MSFVNLMGDVIWSDVDITNKTENMVREHYSDTEREILTRKMVGSIAGLWTLSDEETASLAHFGPVAAIAHQSGIDARADNAMVKKAIEHEKALAIAALIALAIENGVPPPSQSDPQPVLSTEQDVLDLIALREAFRNPIIESEGGNDTP